MISGAKIAMPCAEGAMKSSFADDLARRVSGFESAYLSSAETTTHPTVIFESAASSRRRRTGRRRYDSICGTRFVSKYLNKSVSVAGPVTPWPLGISSVLGDVGAMGTDCRDGPADFSF